MCRTQQKVLKKKIDMQCRLSHGSKKLQFNAAESLKIVVLMWRYEIQWSSSAAWFFLRKSFINSLKFTVCARFIEGFCPLWWRPRENRKEEETGWERETRVKNRLEKTPQRTKVFYRLWLGVRQRETSGDLLPVPSGNPPFSSKHTPACLA